MNTHNLCLPPVIFFLYHWSVELSCGSPLAETILECREGLAEGWLQRFLHLLCAFWGDFSVLLVDSSFLFQPFLIVLFQLLSDSLLDLLILVLLVFESLQGSCFILGELLNKLVFSLLKDGIALLVNLLILKLKTKVPFWNPKKCSSAWAYSTSFQDCSWWRISEDPVRLSSQILHLPSESGEFFQAHFRSKLIL